MGGVSHTRCHEGHLSWASETGGAPVVGSIGRVLGSGGRVRTPLGVAWTCFDSGPRPETSGRPHFSLACPPSRLAHGSCIEPLVVLVAFSSVLQPLCIACDLTIARSHLTGDVNMYEGAIPGPGVEFLVAFASVGLDTPLAELCWRIVGLSDDSLRGCLVGFGSVTWAGRGRINHAADLIRACRGWGVATSRPGSIMFACRSVMLCC